MIKVFRIMLLCALTLSLSASAQKKKDYTAYVDPFIGTSAKGKANPGAVLPYAMVQVNPVTDISKGETDYQARYKYTDSVIYGFAIKHLSGVRYESLCDIVLMPTTGDIKFNPAEYSSKYTKKNETASPGYYGTKIDKYDIGVELTATNRVGVQRFSYPSTKQANIILDFKHYNRHNDAVIEVVNDHELKGEIGGYDQAMFFYMKFSKPFKKYGAYKEGLLSDGAKKAEGLDLKFYVQFDNPGDVIVKTGLSSTGTEGAKKNLDAEVPRFDFKEIQKSARATWLKELSKIEVEGGAPTVTTRQATDDITNIGYGRQSGKKVAPIDFARLKRTVFYTALYHSMQSPNIRSDVDGKYVGMYKLGLISSEQHIYTTPGFNYYTFTTENGTRSDQQQVLSLIDQKRAIDLINGFLMVFDNRDSLYNGPAIRTYIETAFQLTPLIVDMYAKGNRGFNAEKSLAALKFAHERNYFFLESFSKGFATTTFGVSNTLDVTYVDWCIAQMAKMLGKPVDHDVYIQQAQYWKNIHNTNTGFMQARDWNWKTFDAEKVAEPYLQRGNAWQYAFAVPHDINTLMVRDGGKEKFTAKLEEVFTKSPKTISADLVGEYNHAVYAARIMPYLFNFTDEVNKTQFYVNDIMSGLYNHKPDGLLDDTGGNVSAWYVMSALGIYNTSPGQTQVQIGLPQFEKAVVNLENGKTFTVLNAGSSVERNNIYLQGLSLNKKTHNKLYLNYSDIVNGGEFEVYSGRLPNKMFMQDLEKPTSVVTDNLIVPNPLIILLQTFAPPSAVEIRSNDLQDNQFYYTTDGSTPTTASTLYSKPIPLLANVKTVKAIAVKNGKQSKVTEFFNNTK